MAGLRIHTVMSQDLVDRIDSAAATLSVSRGEFVRQAVEQALEVAGSPSSGVVPRRRGPSAGNVALEPGHAAGNAVASDRGVEDVGVESIPAPAEQLGASEQALGGPGNQPRVSAGTQAPAPAEQPSACPRHPDAGLTRVKGSPKLWCAEPGCSASFAA